MRARPLPTQSVHSFPEGPLAWDLALAAGREKAVSCRSSVGVLFVCWKLGLADRTIPRGGTEHGGNFAKMGKIGLGTDPPLCMRTDYGFPASRGPLSPRES